eukprot:TRINITY_DN67046_c4_g3_i1.p1 TRINITY_DN67046_c4_g3~~TRINITY_DN67046_c4_g3_i1.p1  ORF type:complete len:646 (-),score=135.10 TRINITY_DN67046_c4_g3_i1:2093-4030(-)
MAVALPPISNSPHAVSQPVDDELSAWERRANAAEARLNRLNQQPGGTQQYQEVKTTKVLYNDSDSDEEEVTIKALDDELGLQHKPVPRGQIKVVATVKTKNKNANYAADTQNQGYSPGSGAAAGGAGGGYNRPETKSYGVTGAGPKAAAPSYAAGAANSGADSGYSADKAAGGYTSTTGAVTEAGGYSGTETSTTVAGGYTETTTTTTSSYSATATTTTKSGGGYSSTTTTTKEDGYNADTNKQIGYSGGSGGDSNTGTGGAGAADAYSGAKPDSGGYSNGGGGAGGYGGGDSKADGYSGGSGGGGGYSGGGGAAADSYAKAPAPTAAAPTSAAPAAPSGGGEVNANPENLVYIFFDSTKSALVDKFRPMYEEWTNTFWGRATFACSERDPDFARFMGLSGDVFPCVAIETPDGRKFVMQESLTVDQKTVAAFVQNFLNGAIQPCQAQEPRVKDNTWETPDDFMDDLLFPGEDGPDGSPTDVAPLPNGSQNGAGIHPGNIVHNPTPPQAPKGAYSAPPSNYGGPAPGNYGAPAPPPGGYGGPAPPSYGGPAPGPGGYGGAAPSGYGGPGPAAGYGGPPNGYKPAPPPGGNNGYGARGPAQQNYKKGDIQKWVPGQPPAQGYGGGAPAPGGSYGAPKPPQPGYGGY